LEQNGLKEINPIGQKFDHSVHEAVKYEIAPEGAEEGLILKVVEKGYALGSKLIKPAKVIVSGKE
jgi:molecular chaperone GrpE